MKINTNFISLEPVLFGYNWMREKYKMCIVCMVGKNGQNNTGKRGFRKQQSGKASKTVESKKCNWLNNNNNDHRIDENVKNTE